METIENGIYIELHKFSMDDEEIKSKAYDYAFFITEDNRSWRAVYMLDWDDVEMFLEENSDSNNVYYAETYEVNQLTKDFLHLCTEMGCWPTDEDPLGAVVQSVNIENRGYPSINFFLIHDGETIYEDCLN